MKGEAVACIAEWTRHETYGINALLPSVPRLPGWSQPPDVTVLDEHHDADAALRQTPERGGAFVLVSAYLSPLEQSVPSNAPFPPDGQVEIALRYATRKSDAAAATREEATTIRAIWDCLPKLFRTAEGEALRQQYANNVAVQVATFESMREITFAPEKDSTLVAGAVVLTVRVRDLHAARP